MTSQNLIVADGFNLADLAAEMGATAEEQTSGARLPLLKTNRRIKDENKKSLPLGAFYLTGQDKIAYAVSEVGKPIVKFRPLSHHFQYTHYDAEKDKFVSKSRQIASFTEEARSTNGMLRCGKPDGKTMRTLTSEERTKYKAIKNTRLIRGLVSYTGETAEGEKVTYTNEPCLIKLTGQNNFASSDKGVYARFDAQVRDLIPRGYEMWNFDLDIHADEHTSDDGSMFWHTFEWTLNPKDPQAMTQDVYDSVVHIAETIRKENAEVDAAYFDAVKQQAGIDGAIRSLGDDLDDDFEAA